MLKCSFRAVASVIATLRHVMVNLSQPTYLLGLRIFGQSSTLLQGWYDLWKGLCSAFHAIYGQRVQLGLDSLCAMDIMCIQAQDGLMVWPVDRTGPMQCLRDYQALFVCPQPESLLGLSGFAIRAFKKSMTHLRIDMVLFGKTSTPSSCHG